MSNRLFCVEVDGTAMYGRHAKNHKELARVITAALTQWPKSKKVAIVALSRQFYIKFARKVRNLQFRL